MTAPGLGAFRHRGPVAAFRTATWRSAPGRGVPHRGVAFRHPPKHRQKHQQKHQQRPPVRGPLLDLLAPEHWLPGVAYP